MQHSRLLVGCSWLDWLAWSDALPRGPPIPPPKRDCGPVSVPGRERSIIPGPACGRLALGEGGDRRHRMAPVMGALSYIPNRRGSLPESEGGCLSLRVPCASEMAGVQCNVWRHNWGRAPPPQGDDLTKGRGLLTSNSHGGWVPWEPNP